MTENAKTSIFVAIAGVIALAAWATKPSTAKLDVQTLVGQDLTRDFTDPAEARRLRIVQFNEATATLREFEVAEENGIWAIPSKSGYPADAERQMAEAATSILGRKILAVESESPGDHELYGVVDPLSPKLEAGQKGVGTHVTISDIENKPLADLIIGREVKDAPTQRYVREGNRDIVYVVELNPEPLTTDFEKWIEKDLLKLNPWDIQEVAIKDYTAALEPGMTPDGKLSIRIALDPRSEITLDYDDAQAKWTPKDLKTFDKATKEYKDFTLAADEVLNDDKLNELKTALDDLEIVDVARKPAGLSADLKAGTDFLDNADARTDLRSLGFAAIPSRTGDGQEILSSEGEVICTKNDGVEYVLRFGDLRMDTSGKAPDAAALAADPSAGNKNVQRYLFAMARFNKDAIKKPELKELPPLPEGAEAPADQPAADVTAESAATDEAAKPAEDANATKDEAKADEPKMDGSTTASNEESTDESQEPADPAAAAKAAEVEKIMAERKQIEAENQRKLDEYNALVKKGEDEVKDLNLRFGDWYFVVSNDTFQKIRLGRHDVVKKKDAQPATGDPAAAGAGAGVPGVSLPGLQAIPGAGS